MQSAGTSNTSQQNKLVRTDIIYWLRQEHSNIHENNFFGFMDKFVIYLNSTCYTDITAYKFNYAVYEKGSFYKKHFDQFRNDESRQYSMIMYLNEDCNRAMAENCVFFMQIISKK